MYLAEMRFFETSAAGPRLLNVCGCLDHYSGSCDKLTDGDITTSFEQWSAIAWDGPKTITLELCNPAVISAYEWVTSDEKLQGNRPRDNNNDPIAWTLEAKQMDTDEWVLLHDYNKYFTGTITTDRKSIIGPFNVEVETQPACVEPDTCLPCPVDSNSRQGSVGITQCVCQVGFTLDTAAGICTPCTSTESSCECNLLSDKRNGNLCACVDGAYGACGGGSGATTESCTSCLLCPDNSNSVYGSTAITACECNAGYTGSSGTCAACPPATYKSAAGSGACNDCPVDSYANASGTTVCLCKAWAFEQDGVCKGCDAGSFLDSYIPDCSQTWKACYWEEDNDKLVYFCRNCDANQISPVDSVSPADCTCNLGYGTVDGTCTQCEKGTYNDATQMQCQECPIRSTTEGQGRSDVSQCWCLAGTGGPDGGPCEVCLPGTYHEEYQRTVKCLDCPSFSSSNVTGSVSKDDCRCNAGYIASGSYDYLDCQACPHGTYVGHVDDAKMCVACPSGKYNPYWGKTVCYDCLEHSYTVEGSFNSWDCMCNTGYTKSTDDSVCGRCDTNQFFHGTSGECRQCGDNYVSLEGSVSHDECQCQEGYTEDTDGTMCARCSTNQFFDIWSGECTQCVDNSVSLNGTVSYKDCMCNPGHSPVYIDNPDSFRCISCLQGTYKNSTHQEPCVECPVYSHTTRRGSVSIDECVCEFGFSRTPSGECDGICMANMYQVGSRCVECPQNSISLSNSASENDCLCGPGYFSSSSNTADYCEMCPRDTYNIAGTNECTSCPASTHTHYDFLFVDGSVVDILVNVSVSLQDCLCNAGLAGPAGGPCTICDAGTYKSESTSQSPSAGCTTCPVNTNSPTGSYTISNCKCKAGWAGPGGSDVCIECDDDEKSIVPDHAACKCKDGLVRSDLGACETCEVGKYWDDGGIYDNLCLACGMYQIALANSWSVADCMCDYGATQTQGVDWRGRITCEKCDVGTYKDTQGSAQCEPCPTNEFSSTSNKECLCAAGASRQLDGQCVLCQENADAPQESVGACACNPGFKAPAVAGACEICEAGSYGIGGATGVPAICNDCVAGKYQYYAGRTACGDCSANAGVTAQRTGCSCNTGYFALHTFEDFNVVCATCVVGEYYIPEQGMTWCTPCELGTYKNQPGLASCDQCPAHSTTYGLGATEESECLCDAGRFHAGGPELCTLCQAGTYSTSAGATACTECPGNTHSLQGAFAVDDCFCNPGMFQLSTTLAETGDISLPICEHCPAGKYKFVQGDFPCMECPANTDSNMSSVVCDCAAGYQQTSWYEEKPIDPTCEACAVGKYKALMGTSICLTCPENTLNTESGMVSCTTCAQGEILWYSPNGRVCVCTHGYVRLVDSDGVDAGCVPCAAGEYFRQQELACAPCLKGRYKNDTEIRACDRCPDFSSTMGTGAANLYSCRCNPETTGPDGGPCTSCIVGKYKSAFGDAKCSCGMGSKSSSDEGCTLCEAGKYQDEFGALDCKNCPLETVGMPGGKTLWDCLCRKGAFLANSTVPGACEQCPAAKYKSNKGNFAPCLDCYENQISILDGTDCTCGPGYVISQQAFIDSITTPPCIACDAGKYNVHSGRYFCEDCPARQRQGETCECRPREGLVCECLDGYFSDQSTEQKLCLDCFPGSYWNGVTEGTRYTACVLCPDNSSSLVGSVSVDDCVCIAEWGYFASEISDHECISCSVGKYKSSSTTSCLECPIRSSTPNTLPGYATPRTSGGVTVQDCVCDAGSSGENGAPCLYCPAAKYKTAQGSTACLPCPDHSTTSLLGSSTILACQCNTGYFDDATAEYSTAHTCIPCGAGFYRNENYVLPGTNIAFKCQACVNSVSPIASLSIQACQCNAGWTGAAGSVCVQCVAGKYKIDVGAASCVDCPLHTNSPGERSLLEHCVCSPGWTRGGDKTGNCSQCDIGTSKLVDGNMPCTICPHGKNTRTHIGPCMCDVGFTRVIPADNNEDCTPCAVGTYKDTIGPELCELCPTFSTSDVVQGVSVKVCRCNPGATGENGGPCLLCTTGKYKTQRGASLCDKCQSGKYSSAVGGIACEVCPARSSSLEESIHKNNCTCNAGLSMLNNSFPCVCSAGFSSISAGVTCSGGCACTPLSGVVSGNISDLGIRPQGFNEGEETPVYGNDEEAPPDVVYVGEGSALCQWVVKTNDPNTEISLYFSAFDLGDEYWDEVRLGNCDASCLETQQVATLRRKMRSIQHYYYNSVADNYNALGENYHTMQENYNTIGDKYMVQDTVFFSSTGVMKVTFWMPHRQDELSTFTAHWAVRSPTCTACSSGKHKIAYGDGICIDCLANQYTSGEGQVSCLECPLHSKSPASSNSVSACKCDPGWTGSVNASGICTRCTTGTYKATPGNMPCEICPHDNTIPSAGHVDCVCLAGFTGATDCWWCDNGKYKEDIGRQACDLCPANSWQTSRGSITIQDCVCSIGYQGGFHPVVLAYFNLSRGCEMCVPGKHKSSVHMQGAAWAAPCFTCGENTYSAHHGATACAACPSNTVSPSNSTQVFDCICKNGMFGPPGGPCSLCEAGTYGSLGSCVDCPTTSPTENQQMSAPGSTLETDCYSLCPRGKYANQPELTYTGCYDCEIGTYKDFNGHAWCQSCTWQDDILRVDGFYFETTSSTLSTGSTSVSDCMCDIGYTLVDNNDTVTTAASVSTIPAASGAGVCEAAVVQSMFPNVSNSGELRVMHGLSGTKCTWVITGNAQRPYISVLFDTNFIRNLQATVVKLNSCEWQDPGNLSTICVDPSLAAIFTDTSTHTSTATEYKTSRGVFHLVIDFADTITNYTDSEFFATWSTDALQCTVCSIGKYKTSVSNENCENCPPGKFQTKTGQSTCTSCPVDSYSIAGSDAQTDCTCNSGYTGTDGGACTVCSIGKYKTSVSNENCENCPPGKFQTKTGQSTCTSCPVDSYSIAGSDAQTDCTCNSGYTGTDGGACTACEFGKITSASGNTPCGKCPAMYSARSLTAAHANKNPGGCIQFV